MNLSELKAMNIGESCWLKKRNLDILRVPGGWIYSFWDSENDKPITSTFVPIPEEGEMDWALS